ncbi:MAG: MBL fold metallo-hydrolase [Pseudomonadota bacterium]|nr:MBL fold metallo-hydrolase [Pseudomonadota bacterium]
MKDQFRLTRRGAVKLGLGGAMMAGLGGTIFAPFAARAAGMGDEHATDNGKIVIHPVQHASFVMQVPDGGSTMVIYNDPVGGAELYSDYPAPDLIQITHQHGDHYNVETLEALVGDNTKLLTNPAVFDMLPEGLKARATSIGNGESTTVGSVTIDAIPAYNLTEDRLKYHPKGRDNGYVLSIDGKRVYVAGDTEDIPEMRALTGIDIAFVPMNLPFTMDAGQASSAVAEFKPGVVYPYHYKGTDIDAFAKGVADSGVATKVIMGPWYG